MTSSTDWAIYRALYLRRKIGLTAECRYILVGVKVDHCVLTNILTIAALLMTLAMQSSQPSTHCLSGRINHLGTIQLSAFLRNTLTDETRAGRVYRLERDCEMSVWKFWTLCE